MTSERTIPEATDKQIKFIIDLESNRIYVGKVNTSIRNIILRIQYNADVPEGQQSIFVSRSEAHRVIEALLRCKIRPKSRDNSDGISEYVLKDNVLKGIPQSRYALMRRDKSGYDFFEVTHRRSGSYINRLLGSPSNWSRRTLPIAQQIMIGRVIAKNPRAAAIAYGREHGHCSVCNALLSDPKSIALAIGPVCAKYFK